MTLNDGHNVFAKREPLEIERAILGLSVRVPGCQKLQTTA